MNDAERAAALLGLRDADAACRHAQVELFEIDAALESAEMAEDAAIDRSMIAAWRARRASLLQVATEHAARVAVLYSAPHVAGDTLA